ncbi:MAG TPA: peptidoglycan DD-metalloendopeptidase family protein [Chloroflexia bacterium]|nr:peptidoglycan DD-metalloendopeptidase family protein [Chloroflexia bacterium]
MILKLINFIHCKQFRLLILLFLTVLLSASLLLLFTGSAQSGKAQGQTPASYYELKPGQDLKSVASLYGLDARTVFCANPGWQPGQRQVILPLVSARHYTVKSGDSLAQIATNFGVTPEIITAYPLNFWSGCQNIAPLPTGVNAPLTAGMIIYIPDEVDSAAHLHLSTASAAALPGGEQALVDDYQAEDMPNVAFTNPHPLAFQLPVTPTPVATTPAKPAPTATPAAPPVASGNPNRQSSQGQNSQAKYDTRIFPTVVPPANVTQPPFQASNGRPIIWPIHGIITTNFSAAHPGIDIATTANTPVYAAQSGTVIYAAFSPYGYGNFVKIDHGDGRHTHYAHFNSFVVQVGQKVSQGQLLGYEGTTGNSTGPHLHFELVINGQYVDPLQYLPR